MKIDLSKLILFLIEGLSCDNCPDQCEDIDYRYAATQADFVDPRDYFLKALLRLV